MTKLMIQGIDQLPSGLWRVRFTSDGKRRSKSFRTEKAALRFQRSTLVDIDRGDYFDDTKGNQLFRDFAVEYMAARTDLAAGTRKGYESLLRTQLLPTFGDRKMKDITVKQVELWWASKADHPVNRRNSYFLLSSMMKTALRWQLIKQSPCIIEKAGKDVAKPRLTFTVADFRHILTFIPKEHHTLLWTAFSGSLRLGEVYG